MFLALTVKYTSKFYSFILAVLATIMILSTLGRSLLVIYAIPFFTVHIEI